MSYPIIICEDQFLQLQQLESIIQNYILFHSELFQIKLKTQSPIEVKTYLKQFQPKNGIYFLDIDLNHSISGIDLAEMIRKADVQAKIIFVTTHDELAPLTFKRKVEALGFIAKDQPINTYREEIMELLTTAQDRIDGLKTAQKRNFSFSVGSQTFNIDMEDVLFVAPSNIPHRISLYTTNGQYEFYGKLNELEKRYPNLFRVNRSCLINPVDIREIDYSTRTIRFGEELSCSFPLGKAKKIKEVVKVDFDL